MRRIEELQGIIVDGLERLGPKFTHEPKELFEPISYLLALGGKRLRPALCLMSAELFGGKVEHALSPALGIEVFHNFTLMHDDIMDKAPLRRGMPSVHIKWNPNIAILAGDTMFVQSVQLMSQCESNVLKEVLDVFCTTAIEVCQGQQYDMNFETDNEVTISQYLEMIRLKTAVLLACSLKIGAITANASKEDSEHIYHFGLNIGIAFQLQDDILDVYADPKKFGKQPGGDILANKKTYMLLKAMSIADESSLDKLNTLLGANSENKVNEVTQIFDALNIKELARKEMQHYFDESLMHLNAISIAQEKKQVLLSFAESLMVRDL